MTKSTLNRQHILWIEQIQAIARTGLAYTPNEYDQERYEQLLNIAVQMMSSVLTSGLDFDQEWVNKVIRSWRGDLSYVTPRSTSVGAVFDSQERILLVRRTDSEYWDLPGGWCDVGYSPAEVARKEIEEETGLLVTPLDLVGHYDSKYHDFLSVSQVYCTVFNCRLEGGEIQTHPKEIAAAQFFALSELPELLPGVQTSIELALKFHRKSESRAHFDLSI